MLKSFIRFTAEDYTLEDQVSCLESQDEACDVDYTTPVLIKSGDVVKWIMNSSEVLTNGLVLSDIKIGLTSCGILVAEDIGVIVELENQLYITATIPTVEEGCYEFVIYTPYTINCSQFNGNTFQDTIDTGTVFGDALTCTFNDFL